jgi:hypothetical protein
MFSWIRARLTFANLTMIVALVFAMSGGAYAAKRYLINSTGQISPKVLKELKGKAAPAGKDGAQGPPGPAGAQGPAGANGETGPSGPEGKQGTAGKNGESVSNSEVASGDPSKCESRGGTEFKVGSRTATFSCNGKEGSPWTAKGTLPSGSSETGTWAVRSTNNKKEEIKPATVSFPIPLVKAPQYQLVSTGATGTGGCVGGTVENPKAKPGFLCIYEGEAPFHAGHLIFFAVTDPAGAFAPGTTGAYLMFATGTPTTPGEEVSAEGTWAVTA